MNNLDLMCSVRIERVKLSVFDWHIIPRTDKINPLFTVYRTTNKKKEQWSRGNYVD